ncbi:hypothetical protein ACLB2K_007980 [Fragaria x ananassa]
MVAELGLLILFLVLPIFISKKFFVKHHGDLLPSPLALPIIGHFHLLSPHIHRSFHDLSLRFGPIFTLRLGSIPCIVVTSPELAKEFLKTHELSFINRSETTAVEKMTYNASFAFAPYGNYWKFTRKLITNELLVRSCRDSQLFHLRLRRDSFHFNSLTSLAYTRTRPDPPSSRFSSSIVSGLSQGNGEYFTGIGIGVGSPPKYLYMVLDTGSDVVWLQCAPCKRCYSQTDPVFDPRKSSSFSSLPCSSPLCRHLDSPGCSSKSKTCLYQVSYGDGSFTFDDFSTETLTFRRSKIPKVALGCGHDNEGLFVGAVSEAC